MSVSENLSQPATSREAWHEHTGGGCPVAGDETVEIITRAGSFAAMRADTVVWRYGTFISELMGAMPKDAEVVRYRLVRALTPAPADGVAIPEPLIPEEAWQDLLDKDDRTSPEEYPDMALITFEELCVYMLAASPAPADVRPVNTSAEHVSETAKSEHVPSPAGETERDLRELEQRLSDGVFFSDYDEDWRLLGVLRTSITALASKGGVS